MTASGPWIDHFIIGGFNADVLESQFTRLGFSLRPRTFLTGAGEGLCNRIAYLGGNRYLELLSVVDANAHAYGIPAILAVRQGLVRVAMSTDDSLLARATAVERGYEVDGPVRHAVDFTADGQHFRGRFEVVHAARSDVPTLGSYFVNYLERVDTTPFRSRRHANGVVDARSVVVVGERKAVRPFEELLGSPAAIESLLPSEWEALTGLPVEQSHGLPYMAALVFQVEDMAATRRWFTQQGFAVRVCGGRLLVDPQHACNTALFFEQQP